MNETYLLISIISQSVIFSLKVLVPGLIVIAFVCCGELRIILGFCLKWVGRKHNAVRWQCLLLERHCGWKDGNECILRALLCARQFMRHVYICYLSYYSVQ